MAQTTALARSKTPRLIRAGFAALGLVLVGVGIVGIFVPGMPTTICCILALWCFKRSSSRLENWLLDHKWLGPTLRDWEENHWITLRAKRIAIICIAAFSIFGCFMIRKPDLWLAWTIRAAILGFAAFGIGYVATRRTKPACVSESA